MLNIIINLSIFIFVILIGYLLKYFGLFKKQDADMISKLILYLTLPCALLSNANNMVITVDTFKMVLIAISANLILVLIGYFYAKGDDTKRQAAFMINSSGYNIGNFALPFVEIFFPGLGVAYLCMFDIGNAIMGLGITYVMAHCVAYAKTNINCKEILKKIGSSIPFDTYMLMLVLALLHIRLPNFIINTAKMIGSGNGFLAMFMIGLLIEFHIPKSEVKDVINIMMIRMIGNVVISLIIYFLIPLPELAKKILILALFTPIASVAPVFSRKCGYVKEMPAISNSVSIFVSIIAIIVVLLILN
ncbi:AEC family transporter [Clostridium sp.]|uniref:AEC family transporter n=1 Tax=Clostridium sp. TaxID=1506 RepID=UPI001E018C8A|nr:AEC family transporter [Clostridium sp.]MBS5987095.1 AEC family transporter [Clostridium sp.]